MESKEDASSVPMPRYWVPAAKVQERLDKRDAPTIRPTALSKSRYGLSPELPTYEQQSPPSCRIEDSETRERLSPPAAEPCSEADHDSNQLPYSDSIHHFSRGSRPQGSVHYARRWITLTRKTARATDKRTSITSFVPRSAMSDRAPLVHIEDAKAASVFVSVLNSIILDFTARSAIGGTDLSFFIIKQLPALPPETFHKIGPFDTTYLEFIAPRVLELTYTAHDLRDFARDLGLDGPPFRWDAERRFVLRCELDAAFFHLYLPAGHDRGWRPARRSDGFPRNETPEQFAELKSHFSTPREAVVHILDTFPIVRRKDEEDHLV